jgi:hypothetical protein
MQKNSFIKQTEINSAGGMRLTILKQVFDDGNTLAFEEPHQIVVSPLEDFDVRISECNAHLMAMGYPEIAAEELALPASLRQAAMANTLVQQAISQLRAQVEADAAAAEAAAKAEADAIARAKEVADAEMQATVDKMVASAMAKKL